MGYANKAYYNLNVRANEKKAKQKWKRKIKWLNEER